VKLKRILVFFLSILILENCAPINSSSMDETDPSSSSSSKRNHPYPPCNLRFDSSGEIPAPINPPLILPNGLKLEEYDGEFIWPHPDDRGCLYEIRNRASATQIILENSTQIVLSELNWIREKVTVVQDGQIVFNSGIRRYVYSGLLEAWSYDDHWCIEIITIGADEVLEDPVESGSARWEKQEEIREHFDIICDSKSLKNENGYEEIFSFQILNNKPFYFYVKDGAYGINYDGIEAQLEYETLTWFRPHPGLENFIYQFQNMVVFFASRDDVGFEVVIGEFE